MSRTFADTAGGRWRFTRIAKRMRAFRNDIEKALAGGLDLVAFMQYILVCRGGDFVTVLSRKDWLSGYLEPESDQLCAQHLNLCYNRPTLAKSWPSEPPPPAPPKPHICRDCKHFAGKTNKGFRCKHPSGPIENQHINPTLKYGDCESLNHNGECGLYEWKPIPPPRTFWQKLFRGPTPEQWDEIRYNGRADYDDYL